MRKKKEIELKLYRFFGYCLKCKKKFESDEMIIHEHIFVINDRVNLTSKQYLQGLKID